MKFHWELLNLCFPDEPICAIKYHVQQTFGCTGSGNAICNISTTKIDVGVYNFMVNGAKCQNSSTWRHTIHVKYLMSLPESCLVNVLLKCCSKIKV